MPHEGKRAWGQGRLAAHDERAIYEVMALFSVIMTVLAFVLNSNMIMLANGDASVTNAPTCHATDNINTQAACHNNSPSRTSCDKCFAVTHSIADCASFGLDCSHGACARCLAKKIARSACESFGLDCACATVTSAHRRALGDDFRTPRTLPAVAVAVSIEGAQCQILNLTTTRVMRRSTLVVCCLRETDLWASCLVAQRQARRSQSSRS